MFSLVKPILTRRIFRCLILAGILAPLTFPALLYAGGGPFNTLVVINTNSIDSIELGDYYAAAHGIPAHHICRLGVATNLTSVTSNEFKTLLLSPITNHIASENLDGRIDFVVLCWDFPTRVRNVEGVSASLFYGFKNGLGFWDAPYGTCKPPLASTSNEYFRAERAFRSADEWNSTNGFVAFHLIASNLAIAKLVVDRGAAAQSTFPSATLSLYTFGDENRGIRESRFANTEFSFTALPGLPASSGYAPLYEIMSGKTNVMGYHDGFGNMFDPLLNNLRTNNVWLPGAYADHLTSYSGAVTNTFSNHISSQSTVLDWMSVGATASYGTVDEPCNYLEKFSDPLMGFYYARGFTIGEAYAMAVETPYQGLFAGDPLAAPFAAPPVMTVTSQVPYQIVTGTIPVQVSASAHSNGVPAASIDLYLDQRFHTNLTTLGPTPSNLLSIVVADITNSVTIATNDTLFEAVAALADAVNADTNQIVTANATGDRMELIYKAFNHAGDNAPVAASVSQGTASALTLGVGLAATNLAPSIYPARKKIWLYAWTTSGANTGDTVTCVITLTNGVGVTNQIIAAQDESVLSLLERLRTDINNNATLLTTNGVRYERLSRWPSLSSGALFARTPGPDAWGIQVDYTVNAVSNSSGLWTNTSFSSFLDDNPDDIRPRASVLFHVRPTNGVLETTAFLDSTTLADGVHTLDFIARDGSAVAAQSRLTLPIVVCNESPQLSVIGTNGAAIGDGEAPSLANGTDFGFGVWNQPRTNMFSIHNNGSSNLTLTGWSTNGTGAAAFQISGVPDMVAVGGVSNFTVVFAPASGGLFQASLSFDSDAVLDPTNVLFAGTGAYTLAILSEYGTAAPPAGLYTNPLNAVLTNTIAAPAPVGGTQLFCTGWSMSGNDPVSGATTNLEMTVTNDAVLTWLWTTNYWLDTAAGDYGTVNVVDDWRLAGITTQITATADLYYHFTNWTGSVASTNNPLDLLMNTPKTIQANFSETLATNSTPQWWLAQYGWTNDFDSAATNDDEPDGFPAWQEYIADTDPTDSNSFPKMTFIETWQTNPPILTWPFSTGRIYQIHYCDDLVIGDWITQQLSLGAGEWTDTNVPPATNRYYRIAPSLP